MMSKKKVTPALFGLRPLREVAEAHASEIEVSGGDAQFACELMSILSDGLGCPQLRDATLALCCSALNTCLRTSSIRLTYRGDGNFEAAYHLGDREREAVAQLVE